MGSQSAALLGSGRPLGAPLPPFVGTPVDLDVPAGWRLDEVARAHGGVGLAPSGYDRGVFTTVLSGPVRVDGGAAQLADLSDLSVLRRVLDLDADLDELWTVAPQWRGRGWSLRTATPFEALVQALAATNTSYLSTQAMVQELVTTRFPSPEEVLELRPTRWGYRLASLRALAQRVGDVDWDGLPDAAVQREALLLKGFGPFAAASVLPLLGRPRTLLLDGWLARQVPDPTVYSRYGRWGGTVLWLEVSSRWLTGPAARAPGPS